ncbi:unnamed protein product [Staurois parvus]|uniref:Uncharacterized protein n=1 Tax=Staurois parvus TaxID=386267 RepID=A0ABN9FIC7_9NEOB|nr:unnamed protein product [Staurois parvus]
MGRAILTLLCLWSFIVTVTPLTDTQVFRATEYIYSKFKLAGAKQHAYVALFSQVECDSLSSNNNNLQILKNEDAKQITEALKRDENIYQGSQLVLATFKRETGYDIHSEYRLLDATSSNGISPIQQLVNTNQNAACAIFYTLNSPCVGKCANPDNARNIINKLSVFNKFNKAFVYSKLYVKDVRDKGKDDIWDGLTQVNGKMDVYRCSNSGCLKCFEKEQNKLKNKDNCLK